MTTLLLIIVSIIFCIISIIQNPVKLLSSNHKVIKIIVLAISLIVSGVTLSIAEYEYLIPECQNLKVYVPLLGTCIGNALGCSIIFGELMNFIKAKIKNRKM